MSQVGGMVTEQDSKMAASTDKVFVNLKTNFLKVRLLFGLSKRS